MNAGPLMTCRDRCINGKDRATAAAAAAVRKRDFRRELRYRPVTNTVNPKMAALSGPAASSKPIAPQPEAAASSSG